MTLLEVKLNDEYQNVREVIEKGIAEEEERRRRMAEEQERIAGLQQMLQKAELELRMEALAEELKNGPKALIPIPDTQSTGALRREDYPHLNDLEFEILKTDYYHTFAAAIDNGLKSRPGKKGAKSNAEVLFRVADDEDIRDSTEARG